jgi:predicted transcriptional regulator
MLTKDLVYTSLQDLPDEFELDELIERLILVQKIKTGLGQIGEGKVKSHEEVKKMVEAWRKQRGRSRQ